MRRAFIATLALLLAGCATGKDPALAQYEGVVTQGAASGQEYIVSVKFTHPGEPPTNPDALPLCLARVVNAYPADAQVVRYMADDKRRAVADGGVKLYETTFGTVTETLIRYTLDVTISPSERVYAFDKLDQMLLDSPRMGFIRIGAWSGGSGVQAVETLQEVADTINTCMDGGRGG